jgi:predicted AAA+ superfamily ATPase
LGVGSTQDLLAHPKCGASWEGFAIHEIIRQIGARREEAYFWSLPSGAELDLLILRDGRCLGFEIKLTRSPKVTPAMRSARESLQLDHLYVVCHGDAEPWPLSEGISAVPLNSLGQVIGTGM